VVPLARVVVVPPLVLVANTFRGRKRSLTLRETAFLVFAGLRGAIAYALARSSASKHQRTIVAATTAVVLFTTFVLGGTTRLILRTLGMIELGVDGAAEHEQPDRPPAAAPAAVDALGHSNKRSDGGGLALRFAAFDAKWLQPLFGGPMAGVAQDGRNRPRKAVELEPITAAADASGPDDLE